MRDNDTLFLEKLYLKTIQENSKNLKMDWDTLKFNHSENNDHNRLDFFNKNGAVGYIEWSKDDGEIEKIFVGEPYRRKGVGTYIWEIAVDWAKENDQPEPEHSSRRSYDGEMFAQSIGGYIPNLTDDIDGWTSR
jgi:GNAT superfamily N-acetyltransferase